MLAFEETAKPLGIGRALAYQAVRRAQIPSLRVGGRIPVPKAAVLRLERGDGEPKNVGAA